MNKRPASVAPSDEAPAPIMRKAWQTPTIEDADVRAVTEGGGTSGIEGSLFLKAGS